MSQVERTPITSTDLQVKLRSYGVPIDTWGKGSAKTLKHLLDELNSGESSLDANGNGEITRGIRAVGVEVLHELPNGQRLILREARQVFIDGRERVRKDRIASISEKIKPGEEPESAAVRALREELGLEIIPPVDYVGRVSMRYSSEAFPGLTTAMNFYNFRTKIGEDLFREDGYREEQPDKTNYFVWEPVQ